MSTLFRNAWAKDGRGRRAAVNLTMVLVSSVATLLSVEVVFRYVFIRSDSWVFTLSAHKWFERHWKPINSMGFRDVEHSSASLAGKRVVMVVGDSFVTGFGIEDPADRYTNILGKRLGDG